MNIFLHFPTIKVVWKKYFPVAGILLMSLSANSAGTTAGAGMFNRCLTVTGKNVPTTTDLSSSATPSCFGAAVLLTATIVPATTTGTVEFFDGAVSLGVSTISGGIATLTTSVLIPGAHSLIAVYSGDATYDPSTAPAFTQVVDAASPATPGAISGTTTQCPALVNQVYSVAIVPLAATYNWSVPPGWTITSGVGTEMINVTTGGAGQNGLIAVTASNACGTSASSSIAVIVGNAAPGMPGSISGSTGPLCAGSAGLVYSIAGVANATSYLWNLPSSWSITAGAGTASITVTSGNSLGTISVMAVNACGNSTAQTMTVTITPIPASPGVITGTTVTCPSVTGLSYSISAVPNATSYLWSFPVGWTITAGAGTTVAIFSATISATSGNISVAAVNGCGSSAASQTINLNPVNAANNTGFSDNITKFSDGITAATVTLPVRRGYLKFPLAALSVIPVGATVTSVLKLTNNISGVSGGINSVTALSNNDPVTTSAAGLFLAAGTGAIYHSGTWANTGQISLPLLAQANTDLVSNISSPGYIAMALLKSSTGTAVANFWGYSSGINVPVLAVSFATVRKLFVTVSPGTPSAPGTISGNASVCPNSTGNVYSISTVTNATTYTWTIPAGWTISSGQGTTSINVIATAAGGNITVRSGNTCGTSAPGTAYPVTISALPTVAANPATQTKCSGTAVDMITPSSVTGTSYTWTRDNTVNLTGVAASGTGNTITGILNNIASTQQTTIFTIYALNAFGCVSSSPAIVAVVVDPNPVADAGVDQAGCAGTPVTIGGTPTASAGTPGYSYLWSAGVSNNGIANPTALPGSYTVTVTDSKGCSATDAVTVTNSTGTKTWIGSGTGNGGPDNNFNNPLNWTPAGVPGACNDVTVTVDVTNIFNIFSGTLSINLTADATIKSLAITVGGTLAFTNNTSFTLNVGTRAFKILNATSLNTIPTVVISTPAKSFINVGSGGVLTYGGNLTTTVSGTNTNYPFYASVNNLGKVYINGNAGLGGIGNDASNKPARIIFDGGATQTISNNSGGQAIYLAAASTEIGEINSPMVILAGAGTIGFRNLGDLNINNTATLDIGAVQTMNRNAPGGIINLAPGTFLKLGKGSGGVGSSNFPSNFSTFNFNATSTVDYNASAGQTVFAAPLYGNLTLSGTGNKTATGNITAQKNITIQGAAIFQGGVNTIRLAGNWTNYGQVGFSEQTSSVEFNGTVAQTISTTGGEVFYTLNKTSSGTTSILSDVAAQGGGTSSFTLSSGIFDAGIFSFNSAASSFNISAGLLKLGRTGATTLPEFGVATYNLTGGTIELYGAGDQVLRGSRDYRNLTFSTSGTKTVTSAINSIIGTLLTQNNVTLDVSNNTMGGAGTNLTMTGTSLYRTAGTGTKPDAQGTYLLGGGTTVAFTNNAGSTEDVRLIAPTYYNVIIAGTNVANASAGTGIKFQTGGSFTLKNAGLFKLANTAGFSGSLSTAIANTNNPSITLEDGSTVEYYGGATGINPQLITNVLPYYSLQFSGASIKTAPAGIITVKGNLSNTASGFFHGNGSVLLNGTVAQNYNSVGTPLIYNNLTITNPVNFNVNGNLVITRLLSLGTTGRVNLVSGNIELQSAAGATAAVDRLYGINNFSYTGIGRFIIDRYIPTGIIHGKSWQFLAAPAFGETLNKSWQESNGSLVVGTPGYGTTITSEKAGAISRGYDFYTPGSGPSLKSYDAASGLWTGIDDGTTPTNVLSFTNPKGYMVFVRGDRSIQTSTAPANPTILRTWGKLYSPGTDAPPSLSVLPGKFESIGNPYASTVDFLSLLGTSSGIDGKYYVWDPLLAGSSSLGGYQVLSSVTGWVPTPGGTINYPAGTPYSKVQSGQAFFVYSTPGGTINFDETNKINGSQLVYRQNNLNTQFLKTYLSGPSGFMADGNVVAIDPSFKNSLDANDALKISNTGENLGIANHSRILAVDTRSEIAENDTIFYNMSGMRLQPYQLKISPEGFSSNRLAAFLTDKFTQATLPVSLTDSTFINFQITSDALSFAPGRFYIVFKRLAPVPVAFVKLDARRQDKNTVLVNWNVGSEININRYEIQRSSNGRSFSAITMRSPQMNNGNDVAYYNSDLVDSDILFYRIAAVSIDGLVQYSNIANVSGFSATSSILIYPNPVAGRIINVYFNNIISGDYLIRITNKLNQVVLTETVSVSGTNFLTKIPVSKSIIPGSYQVSITAPGAAAFFKQIIIE